MVQKTFIQKLKENHARVYYDHINDTLTEKTGAKPILSITAMWKIGGGPNTGVFTLKTHGDLALENPFDCTWVDQSFSENFSDKELLAWMRNRYKVMLEEKLINVEHKLNNLAFIKNTLLSLKKESPITA